ncbi:aminotransferase class I/II-fold pyridoxal phosphate-dependent enzyme [Actinomyces sp. 594]|uniref:MalY/PatB family protein n=1 Tax=Actinomyces sp. 594 TaxID=2057793 RepID=UPI001C5A3D5B|nr:aminotransferase class I/II-fold pyridoxal phosphate-dependent enzyme [Actinomyces sp. 594]MBW3069296.1 aminotransferase class I/II-fold pyridoxal phosphate-dependent enzyme [Actinomyces sp. 594]
MATPELNAANQVSGTSLDEPAPAFDATRTIAEFDALTPEVMRKRGSLKWTMYPGDVIGAWVAEMDLGTAPSVTAVLHRAVMDGSYGYLPPRIAESVSEQTARFQGEAFGWQVDAQDVSLLPDVLSALGAVIAHHTRPGSAVIVPTPAYMPFLSYPGLYGRECVQVPSLRTGTTDSGAAWALDLDRIEAAMAAGAGLLVLCNPWNPVGRVLSPAELDAVAELSARYRVPVFADEIHNALILDPQAVHTPYASRPGTDPDLTFTATAASKGWNTPGLKCAQLIASAGARQAWDDSPLSKHLANEASLLGAQATVAALADGQEWIDCVRGYIRANAQLAEQALADVEGVEITVPSGTYLAWLDCSGLPLPEDVTPAEFFRREPGVVMNDGAAFGSGYERFCRLNLATGRRIEEQTVQRLADAVARLTA